MTGTRNAFIERKMRSRQSGCSDARLLRTATEPRASAFPSRAVEITPPPVRREDRGRAALAGKYHPHAALPGDLNKPVSSRPRSFSLDPERSAKPLKSQKRSTRSQSERRDSEASWICQARPLSELSAGLDREGWRLLPHFIWGRKLEKLHDGPPYLQVGYDGDYEYNIVALMPGAQPSSDVRCGLIKLLWSEEWPFTYVLGAATLSKEEAAISLNGRPFWISRSLEAILRSLRSPDTVQFLFVWPICIPDAYSIHGEWAAAHESTLLDHATHKVSAVGHLSRLGETQIHTLLSHTRYLRAGPMKAHFSHLRHFPDSHMAPWKPLDPMTGEVRLVRLQRNSLDDSNALRLEMVHGSLDHTFMALSYCCGTSAPNGEIEVNGCKISVR
jgi:hypothetical protein